MNLNFENTRCPFIIVDGQNNYWPFHEYIYFVDTAVSTKYIKKIGI